MAQNYGTSTSNIMDRPLALRSVFAPYVGDGGYKFTGSHSVQVVSTPDGTLSDYDENSTSPITVGLVGTELQTLTLSYNKAMFERIQKTLMQDQPVNSFAAKWARQQIEDVFVPNHDVYSLGKTKAARPVENIVTVDGASLDTEKLSLKFGLTLNKITAKGADANRTLAWVNGTFSAHLADQIQFTGSDAGYKDAKNTGYLGRHKGVKCVEVPDSYLDAGTFVLMADKRAIVNVAPKMRPDDYQVLTKIPGFSGAEVQIRDRADTFVLNKKVNVIATIEDTASTTTTTTTV